LIEALKKRVHFGDAVPDNKLLAFVTDRAIYADKLEGIKKSGLDEQTKARTEESRDQMGLGELPEEWANAFMAADEDTGWVASAHVVGQLKQITIAEILTSAGVDPLTGRTVAP
jgi:hypothetical protein